MRLFARYCGVLFAAALILPPAQAAHHKAVGVVSQADLGHIDTANAVAGADVYDCDNLETEEGGEMRLQVQSGQVFLAAGSAGQLQQGLNGIEVYVNRGTVGFSSMAGAAIDLVTPAGFVRAANGQAVSGEVTITGPKEMLITAMRGDLVLDNGGEIRTIPQGQTAKITFDDGLEPACHVDNAADQRQNPVAHHRIGFYFVGAAAVGVPAILLWRDLTESDYVPPN
jgi:hypothetical protein